MSDDDSISLLAALWQQWGEIMTEEARRNHAGADTAEDFLMDLLLKILAKPPDMPVEHGAPISDRYIKRVLHNMRVDAYRAENRHRRILRDAGKTPGGWLYIRPGESAEATVMRRMEEADVIKRIGRLPGHLRDAALLRYEGYSYAEIGQALGITERAARKRIGAIRSQKIRATLD